MSHVSANRQLLLRFITLIHAVIGLLMALCLPACSHLNAIRTQRLREFLRITRWQAHREGVSLVVALIVASNALNVAIWQQLAAGIVKTMVEELGANAVLCRTSPGAIAIGWGNLVLAIGAVLTLVYSILRSLNSETLLKAESSVLSSAQDARQEEGGAAGNEEESEGIGMEDRLPGPSWNQPATGPNLAWLQAMLYLSGQSDPGYNLRQRHTATWVRESTQREPGFAQTVVEEP